MYQCSCCYSSETGLDKLWPRVHDVVSRAMTLWADEHLREPAWANADTAGIVIKSRAISDSIWRQPGATVWTKLISKLHSARTIWYSSNWIDCTNIAIRIPHLHHQHEHHEVSIGDNNAWLVSQKLETSQTMHEEAWRNDWHAGLH